MYHVYLLRSLKDEKLYIGYSGDLKRRIEEHMRGEVEATQDRRPLKLLYYESYSEERPARERERQLKKFGSSYKGLVKRIGIV